MKLTLLLPLCGLLLGACQKSTSLGFFSDPEAVGPAPAAPSSANLAYVDTIEAADEFAASQSLFGAQLEDSGLSEEEWLNTLFLSEGSTPLGEEASLLDPNARRDLSRMHSARFFRAVEAGRNPFAQDYRGF
ncbi:MAG: hypothetical protein AAF555_10920 [Verrucomicrobiota bacterium]